MKNEEAQLSPAAADAGTLAGGSGRVEALLAHTDWVQRLARQLVGDPNEAAEVVQEAWVQALERPPEHDGNLRGWLARVVRRSIYRRRRAALLRSDHEARASGPPPARTPATLANEVAIQRELQGAVLALPEAYRDVLLLRYFEDLPPRKIAERTATPIATVKSRLHRGTELLRNQLDKSHGGSRTEWMLALVPLASKAVVSETVATTIGLGVAGTLGAATLIGGTVVMVPMLTSSPESTRHEPTSLDSRVVKLESNNQETDDKKPSSSKQRRTDGRRELPIAPPPETSVPALRGDSESKDEGARSSTLIAGVAVELDGVPAPHVRMRRQSKNAVRWQSGDRGWISGPGGSRRISRADEERAREDRDFAKRLLKDAKNVKEWRATLLDAPLPGQDQRTSLAGTFQFDTGEALEPLSIEVADPGWIELAFGERTLIVDEDGDEGDAVSDAEADGTAQAKERRELAWIVSKAHRIEAEVRDASGAPLDSGRARVAFDVAQAITELPFEFKARRRRTFSTHNVQGGSLLIRSAPAVRGAYLEIDAPGHRTKRLRIPRYLPDPFIVQLEASDQSERWRVTGRVVDSNGVSVPNALVAVGRSQARADARGEYELNIDRVGASTRLIATGPEGTDGAGKRGRGAKILEAFGRDLASGKIGDSLDLVLDEATGVVRGRIDTSASTGTSGARGGEWRIALDDPTLLAFSFTSVETRAAGIRGDVIAEPDGSFELKGLFDRPYALRIWKPGTGIVHIERGVRPGDSLTIKPQDAQRSLTGRVENGAGATVAIAHRTFATASGEGGLFDAGPAVTCDETGSFRLENAPTEGAFLSVTLASGDEYVVPVELIPRGVSATIQRPELCLLEVRSRYLDPSAGAWTLQVESASGRVLGVTGLMNQRTVESIEAVDGRFPMLMVPASATAAVVIAPGGSATVLPVATVPGGRRSVEMR